MLGASRSAVAILRSLTIAAIVGGASVVACSSSESAGPPKCDSAKCAPGNTCLPLNGETKCRKTCSSNADPQTSCPFGYTCVDTEQEGVSPFCIQDTARAPDGNPLQKKAKGQWGAACQANNGLTNPDCDTDQGFYCFGNAPTDPDAYCTMYGCEQDSDCGAGFGCVDVDVTPNVETAKHKVIGETQKVCVRRAYCSPCKVDLDCAPIAGRAQHCVDDESGARICAPECDTTQACPVEAKCVDSGAGAKVCFPRAGACVGDGSLCSPCRVDTDCGEDGACVKGAYTTEKTCAKKAPESCGTKDKPAKGGCPDKAEQSGAKVMCLGRFFDEVPPDYCHGTYNIGSGDQQSPDIGCYSPARK